MGAAAGETFAALSSEYLLSAGASCYEQKEFTEALHLFADALQIWRSSRLARILEPKVGWIANTMQWACLHQVGTESDALPFLQAAAETPDWTCFNRCERWLQFLREAYAQGNERHVQAAFRGSIKHCSWWNTELRHWKGELR